MFIYKSATIQEDLGNGVKRRVMAHGGKDDGGRSDL